MIDVTSQAATLADASAGLGRRIRRFRRIRRPAGLLARLFRRVHLLACGLLLALLPFVTAPGHIIDDTKLNLVVNPDGFLARALSLWDPQQFGELQNQTVGYLFPMGPFFALGKLAAVPSWVIQRLWIAVVLMAAFYGTVRLAGKLGIGTPWTRVAAGFAYALSPIALSMIGELSGEFLPMAMLPWILLPLASAARGTSGPGAAPRPGRRSRSRCAAASTPRRPSRCWSPRPSTC